MADLEAVYRSIVESDEGQVYFFDNPDVDRLMYMVLALSGELSVAVEQVHRLEQMLMQQGLISEEQLNQWSPSPEQEQAVLGRQRAMIARVLRVLEQEGGSPDPGGAAER